MASLIKRYAAFLDDGDARGDPLLAQNGQAMARDKAGSHSRFPASEGGECGKNAIALHHRVPAAQSEEALARSTLRFDRNPRSRLRADGGSFSGTRAPVGGFLCMPALKSQALSSVQYDALRERLRATFRESGRTYEYYGVSSADYAALMRADSRGAWFNAHIRDQFPCRELA